ncbi:unnamed protein product [Ceratitis capitata]|uniref:(Mediterranean fruit fly) hypothetical protein n=1 Tax=Ceratitis capitata TaxID=7213 RepID=A0A811USR2_CERCA|nr:unnamed protein product [Ceratitis capitata]CAD7003707.1 unnamed protein product [Ceratitis capitata]
MWPAARHLAWPDIWLSGQNATALRRAAPRATTTNRAPPISTRKNETATTTAMLVDENVRRRRRAVANQRYGVVGKSVLYRKSRKRQRKLRQQHLTAIHADTLAGEAIITTNTLVARRRMPLCSRQIEHRKVVRCGVKREMLRCVMLCCVVLRCGRSLAKSVEEPSAASQVSSNWLCECIDST